jgi:hypothetical protein
LVDIYESQNVINVVVPPQIMIQTAVGEAGAQTASGDATIPALFLAARNRFGDSSFYGGAGATWQSVLNSNQFYGANNTTSYGIEPELDYAAAVFAGTTSVTLPSGCKAFWSPTSIQFATLQTWTSSISNTISGSQWSSLGAPDIWRGQAKQAVIKTSVANNQRGGNYANAPAFVFFQLAPSATAPAVVTVP